MVALSGGEERQADFHLTPIPSIHLKIPRGPEAAEGDRGSRTPVVQRGGDGMVQAVVTTSGTEWDIGGLAPGSYTVRMGFGQDQPATQIKVSAGASTVVGLDQVAVSGTPVSVTADGVEDGDVRQITLVNVETGESVAANGGRRGRGRNGDDDSPAPTAGWTITAPAGRYGVFLNGAPGLYLLGLSATGAEVVGRTVTLNGGTPKLVVHAAKGRGTVEGMAKRDGRPISGAMVLLVPAGFGQPSKCGSSRAERDEYGWQLHARGGTSRGVHSARTGWRVVCELAGFRNADAVFGEWNGSRSSRRRNGAEGGGSS